MAKVGIVMGSDSDMPVMVKAADILEELGIEYDMRIISAHREPDEFFEYAKSRNGGTSSRNVRCDIPYARYRNPYAHNFFGRP